MSPDQAIGVLILFFAISGFANLILAFSVTNNRKEARRFSEESTRNKEFYYRTIEEKKILATQLKGKIADEIAKNERLKLAVNETSINRALQVAAQKIRDAVVYVQSEVVKIANEMDPPLYKHPLSFLEKALDKTEPLEKMIEEELAIFDNIVEMARENGFVVNDDYRTFLVPAKPAEIEPGLGNPDLPPPTSEGTERIKANIISGGDPDIDQSGRYHCLGSTQQP